jgi:hypothetical protein
VIRELLEPYLVWIRLGAVIIAAFVIAFAVVTVKKWHRDSLALASAKAETAEIAAQAQLAIETLAAQQRAAYAASEGFQREIQELRDRPVPVRTVRVLVPARAAVPAAGATPGRPDAGAQAAGVVHPDAGQVASRDIGPDLYALTLEADRCSAQLRGLQAWVTATR